LGLRSGHVAFEHDVDGDQIAPMCTIKEARDVNAPGLDRPAGRPSWMLGCVDERGVEGGDDEEEARARVLIVAIASQLMRSGLVDAISARATAGAGEFHLLLPDPAEHAAVTAHQRRESRARGEALLREALPVLSEAAGFPVDGSLSRRHDPMDAIEEMLQREAFDEILLAITHHRLAERLHVDLPRRVEHLGLRVTTVFGESLGQAGDG
jgi:hypothetical protein